MSNGLKPCPFCGSTKLRIDSNRDWHKLMGTHEDACPFDDDYALMVPATPEDLAQMVANWNRRTAPLPAAPAPTEQQDELPITRSTYGSLEACEAEQARRNAARAEQAGELPPLPTDAAAWVSPLRYGSKVTFPKPVRPEDDEEEWCCHPLFTTEQMNTHARAALAARQAPAPAAADGQAKPVAWAVESNIGTGVRAFVKFYAEEGEADRFAARHQAAYAGAERVKVPLYRAAPLPRQAAVRGEDAARLDWLEQAAESLDGLMLHDGRHPAPGRNGLGLRYMDRTLRQAVDSVRGVDAAKSAPATTEKEKS